MTTAPAVAPQPVPPLSEPERLINTFIAPSKTFCDLRRASRWWVPWLVLAVVSVAFIYLIGQKVGFDQVAHNMVANSSRAQQMEQLSPEQRAQQYAKIAAFTRTFAYASPASLLVIWLVVAAILMSTFRFGMGAEVSFPTSLAIVSYGNLPAALGALLGMLSLVAGANPETFNINNPVASNIAYFMDMSSNKFLYTMASALDVFTIWTIVLLGIGFACNSKVKRSTAIVAVASWYVLYKLIAASLALLS